MLRYIPDPAPEQAPLPSRFTSRWLRSAGGAELNLTVALANLGWGGRARWISVVPHGRMGEELLSLASAAYPDGGAENLGLVRRAEGDVGIYHVWPDEGKVAFQRRNSTFGLMDPDMFDEHYWRELLSQPTASLRGGPSPPHVLHLTGITPLIGARSHKAWWRALRVARELKAGSAGSSPRVLVTLDLNHRPALGTFEDLWVLVEPHIGTLDLLVLSVGDLVKLGGLLGVPEAASMLEGGRVPKGLDGAAALEAAVQQAMAALQRHFGHRCAIAVCCKQRDTALRPAGSPPVQLRWSMVCLRTGEFVSTSATAIKQEVLEEIGGGDSWLSGCIDGLVGSEGASQDAAPKWTKEMWRSAMQRGDMLATLKQRQVGDFSHVERRQLDESVAKHVAGRR